MDCEPSRNSRRQFGLAALFEAVAICCAFFAAINYMGFGGAAIVAYLLAPYVLIPLLFAAR